MGIEIVGRKDVALICSDPMQIQACQMRFDQIRKQQMRKGCQFPRPSFFHVEDDANEVVQVRVIRVDLLVVSLQSLFQLPESD